MSSNILNNSSLPDFSFRHPGLRYLGYITLIALVVMAGIFYRERVFFSDIALQLFLLIKAGTFQVMVYRFGAAVVQFLPLLAIKLDLPLDMVAFCYSISFTLIYLLFYFVTVRILKNEYLGWALVFIFTLIALDAFYWITSELQQGLAFLMVYFAFVLKYPSLNKVWHWALALLGLVAIVYYHPLLFFVFFFLWLYFGLHFSGLRQIRYAALGPILMLILAFKFLYSSNFYDDNKYGAFRENLIRLYPNYFQMEAHSLFLENCLYYWYLFPIFLLALTILYFQQRTILKLLLLWGSCFCYIMVLHIGFPNPSTQFYAEVHYLSLSVMVGVPFIFEIVPRIKNPKWVLALFATIVIIRLSAISMRHTLFTNRLDWISQIMDEAHGSDHFIMQSTPDLEEKLLMSWGVCYESLYLTASEHPDSAKTLLLLPNFDRYQQELQDSTYFLTAFKVYQNEQINSAYFRLKDQPYIELPITPFEEK